MSIDQVYQVGDIDHINVFNGNLVVQIPIGPRYPVGGKISYGLTLTFNSKVWDFKDDFGSLVGPTQATINEIPSRTSNAGLGWLLSLGRILYRQDPNAPFSNAAYESPDGTQHPFYCTLHADECTDTGCPAGVGLPGQVQGYTRDNTYLRMIVLSNSVQTPKVRIEFPDGSYHDFEEDPSAIEGNDHRMRLTQMNDRFGNWVKVNYSPNTWTITDTVKPNVGDPRAVVHFQAVPGATQTTQLNYQTRVASIDVAKWTGTTATNSFETYQFRYEENARVTRGCVPSNFKLPFGSPEPQVPLLSNIIFPENPDTHTFLNYTFEYLKNAESALDHDECATGSLKRIVLPTGGEIRYTWQRYELPAEGCTFESVTNYTGGVKTRQLLDTVHTQGATWQYATKLDQTSLTWNCTGTQPSGVHNELKNTVTTPTGEKVDHYFSVYPLQNPTNGWRREEYGLPFTRANGTFIGSGCNGTPQPANCRFLSTVTVDKNNREQERSYVSYEMDPASTDDQANPPSGWQRDVRVAATRNTYTQDGGKFADTANSDFDGVGHYRSAVTSGNFVAANSRTTVTSYNPGKGIHVKPSPSSECGAAYWDPTVKSTEQWILETFTSRSVTEGNSTLKSLFNFDANGFLQAQRTQVQSTSDSRCSADASGTNTCDVIAVFTPNSGNLVKEQYYGGETSPTVKTGWPSSSATPTYEIEHGYSFGVRNSSHYNVPSTHTSVGFLTLDDDIDHNTGLVNVSRDVAKISTTYKYDYLGRLKSIEPQSGHGPRFSYTYVTDRSPYVDVKVLDNSGQRQIDRKFARFDSLGRLWMEFNLMPDLTWGVRGIEYDGLSRQKRASERQSYSGDPVGATPNFLNWTTFDYDYLGRPVTVTPPDSTQALPHLVTHVYTGVSSDTETVTRATSGASTELSTSTKRIYDRQGRLAQVEENSNNTNADTPVGGKVTTTYTYEAGGKVASVSMDDGTGAQPRTFQYDGRGFLTKENHPENGDTVYSGYDARGHATKRVNGGKTLNFEYDVTERLHKITDGGGALLKEFDFADSNGSGDFRQGKLVTAIRRNTLDNAGTVDVTETYTYGGANGQMSERNTLVESVNGSTRTPIQTFDYRVSYDDLLLPETITMPTCAGGDCSSDTTKNAIDSIHNSRTSGYLTSVDKYGALTYHPSGMVASVTHTTSNKPVDQYDERFGMPRPTKITFGSCGDTTPYFLPGSVVANPTGCGLQISWPTAVWCGFGSSIQYKVLRDGADISGCLIGKTSFVDPNPGIGVAHRYSVVAEGPASGNTGNTCQGGFTTTLDAPAPVTLNACATDSRLDVGNVVAPIGVLWPFTAKLSTSAGPVQNEELVFTILGKQFTARTGADGLATVHYTIDIDPAVMSGGIVVEYKGGLLPAVTKTADLQAACSPPSFNVRPSALNVKTAGGGFPILVGTSVHCVWDAAPDSTWTPNAGEPPLTVSPNGQQKGTATFTINVPSTQAALRSSNVTAALHKVTVTQTGDCSYHFTPDLTYLPADTGYYAGNTSSGLSTMDISAPDDCHWDISSDQDWIHFVNNPNGTPSNHGQGNGTVRFQVENNFDGPQRKARLSVDGTNFSANINQAILPAVQCPALQLDLFDDPQATTLTKNFQNVTLRAYATGTRLQYDWFINDRPCNTCNKSGSLVLLPGDEGYPNPGESVSFQAGIHVDPLVPNHCGTISTKKVTWRNQVPPGACKVPLIYDSLFRVNQWPSDGNSLSPGAPAYLIAVGVPSDSSLPTYAWYQGTAGNRSPIPNCGNSDTCIVAPTVTSFYWVEVTDSCGSQQSRTSAITVTPLPGRVRPCCRYSITGTGHDDLLWHNKVTGQNEVWQMTGNAVHNATYPLPAAAPNTQIQSLGDLNGDEKVDLLWRDPTTGANSVWLMNYTNLNSVVPLEPRTDPHWTIGAVGDLTAEGNDDIVWHNSATGENEIWFQNGTDHAGTWALPSNATANWGLHGVGDFSGDGKPDLFFHNAATGQNEVWTIGDAKVVAVTSNSSGGTLKRRMFTAKVHALDSMTDTNWVPAAVADMNGDGHPDIVWRNVVTGENSVWIMSGTTHFGTVPMEPRSDLNWEIGGGGSTNAGNVSGGGGGSGTTSSSLQVPADAAPLGTAAVVTATLTAGSTALGQRELVFSLNGAEAARLNTDGNGTATAPLTVAGIAAGSYAKAISVRFDGDTTYTSSSATADLVVTGTQPVITWSDPAAIVYGTPLGAAQLNATANVPGTFVYSPAAGAVLSAGYQTLSVTFTPTDTTLSPISDSVVLVINKAPSSVSWTAPSSIVYGVPLSQTQLNAASPMSGAFTYDPGPGTVLPVGAAQTLRVTFVPDDSNFAPSQATTTIDVDKGKQIIRWDDPAPITVLQPLSNVQLNAVVTRSGDAPAGQVTYDPPAGTILPAGISQLRVSVAETPSYEAASASVDIIVNRAAPVVQWATPANIVYGTALSSTQLNATADVAGTFDYTPAAGTVLDAGQQVLTVVFTPADDRYDSVTVNVTIQVDKAAQSITWSNPAPIVYGTPLTEVQLNATVHVGGPKLPGLLVYSPPPGTILGAGAGQTLTVTAEETDNYTAASASVKIDVVKATPVITWAAPAPIVYGTPLSATQLNATTSVAGTFVYTPAAGTILNAGAGQTLQVAFTPADTANYTNASASTLLTVTKASQTITWPTPADIVYGTALSATQLNATVSVVGPAPAGALTYTPSAGTVLQAGAGQTLTVAVAETPNYNAATAAVLLTVQKAKPVLAWPAPAGIVYGTALSATQLDATADVPGSFVYTPPSGTILSGGAGQTLSVAFTPTDTHNYENAAASVTIDVARAKQTLAWTAPAAIVYGTRLGGAQLDATVTVVGPAAAGTLVYTPPSGTALDAGAGQTLTVTAQETQNYLPATMSVAIDVNRAPLTLRVDNQSKLYGAPLPALTGTLTGVMYADPITPLYSTTATAASVVGTYPITGRLADPNGRLRNYDVTIVPATLTVVKAPLFVTADNLAKQYSDAVPQLTVSFRGFVLNETPAVLGGTLLLQTDVTKDTGPGTYPIAVGGLTSPNYDITFVAGTLTVNPEDAAVSFIAPLNVAASPVTGQATVTLASLVKEVPDGSLGDIRKASLTFIDRATGKTLCTAPIGLVAASDTSVGVATCTFTAVAGTYTIESRVGAWYVRDAAADDVTLSVVTANDDYITGSGSATLTGSGGRYAADDGSHFDFNLNPQYAKDGTIKGSVTLTFRRTENGTVHVYQLDSSALASMAIVRAAAGGTAFLIGPAALTDVTTAKTPVVIDSNASLVAAFADNGEPARNDTLAVTLLTRSGGLLFSSKWNGARTVAQTIDDGDIQVHVK